MAEPVSRSEAGAGEPVVLVHGSPGDARSWGRVFPLLADRFRVVAIDLPGYGHSDPLPEHEMNRTAAMGAVVSALIETLGEPARLWTSHPFGETTARGVEAGSSRKARTAF